MKIKISDIRNLQLIRNANFEERDLVVKNLDMLGFSPTPDSIPLGNYKDLCIYTFGRKSYQTCVDIDEDLSFDRTNGLPIINSCDIIFQSARNIKRKSKKR